MMDNERLVNLISLQAVKTGIDPFLAFSCIDAIVQLKDYGPEYIEKETQLFCVEYFSFLAEESFKNEGKSTLTSDDAEKNGDDTTRAKRYLGGLDWEGSISVFDIAGALKVETMVREAKAKFGDMSIVDIVSRNFDIEIAATRQLRIDRPDDKFTVLRK